MLRAYGSADLEHGVAIDPATVFEIGSVSKQFTAAAVLILIEQGKLAFDDDVRKYVPELPDYGAKITIAQLLGHTSGLREYEEIEEIAGWPLTTRIYTLKDTLEVAARQRSLNFQPGAAFSYSSTGYTLLAIIAERVSGTPLTAFTRDHLFEPLGMTHTQWRDDFRRVVKGRAIAYDADAGGYHQFMPFSNVIGSGGLLSTVADLLKWNEALDTGALGSFVTAELQRQSTLLDGRAISYARGLYVASYHGVREIWHAGERAGYLSFLARYPDQHLSIALLCNAGEDADASALGDRVADLFLPAPDASTPAGPKTTPRLTDEQLAPYAGLFFNPKAIFFQMRLDVKNGVLRRESDGLEFAPVAAGDFKTRNSTIHFTDKDHFVREFTNGGASRAEYQRMQPWHPEAAQLSELAGRYESAEALATYDVSVENGHLVLAVDDRRWDRAVLDPVSTDMFKEPDAVIRFIRAANGRVSSLEIGEGHVYSLSFRRIGDAPDPHKLDIHRVRERLSSRLWPNPAPRPALSAWAHHGPGPLHVKE